jgi:xylulokinase
MDVYDLLCREAQRTPPGSEGLIFLPHLSGMRTPEPNPDAKGVFFGITLRHGKPHFVRAILEGVAFGVRDSIEIFKELRVPVGEVRSIGGGSRSEIWRQIQADVLGLTHCTVNVTECAAFGAALLAAVGAGAYASVPEACRATIQPLGTSVPVAENAHVYDGNYRLYRALVQSVYQHQPAAAGVPFQRARGIVG